MTIGDNYQYATVKPLNYAERVEQITTTDLSFDYQYAKIKPVNMAEKAQQLGQPENKPSQMSGQQIDQNRQFNFKDSTTSDTTAIRKQVHQELVREALLTKAAMIKGSHDAGKAGRPDSSK